MKVTQLHIPEPCSADWNAMTGDEKRKFCDACAKHVHDLSAMTLREAEAILGAERNSGHLCIRYAYDASGDVRFLKRRVRASAPSRQLSGVARLTAAAAAFLTFAGVSELLSAPHALAQTQPNQQPAQIIIAGGISAHDPNEPTSPWTGVTPGPRVNPNKQEILDRLASQAGEGSAETCDPVDEPACEMWMGEAPAYEPAGSPKVIKSAPSSLRIELQLQAQERAAAARLGRFGMTLEEEEIILESER